MKKLLLFATIAIFLSNNVFALEPELDWPVKTNSLKWPIANAGLEQTTIFFDHDDSAGVPQTDCSGKQPSKHLGLDIAAAAYTPVYPIADGVVKRIGSYEPGSGWYVVVESGTSSSKKWTTVYGHLNEQGRPVLNDKVSVKSTIGTVFNMTDKGDIPHLHLGIRPFPYSSSVSGSTSSATFGFLCSNTPKFVDPLVYLKNKDFVTADDNDASSIAGSHWEKNKRTNPSLPYPFYFKTGYSSLDATKNESFIFNTSVPKTGYYNVFVRWTVEQASTSNRGVAYYTVKQNGKSFSNTIDQSGVGARGRWKKLLQLDQIYLSSGSPITIEVSPKNHTPGRFIIADAVMIVAVQ